MEPQLTLSWGNSFPRALHAGGSEGYLGAHDIYLITRPFTKGEEQVLAWAEQQDGATLVEIVPLQDGRDLLILARDHTRQTRKDAENEHRFHIMSLIRSRGFSNECNAT